MKRVDIEQLKPGMVIARSIYGPDGRALLTENTELTAAYITRLSRLELASIYIKDGFDDLEIPEVVSRQTINSVSRSLNKSFSTFASGKALNVQGLKSSLTMLLQDLISNRHLLIQLEDIRSHSDYLFMHTINVTMLSIMTGLTLGYPENKLIELGLGTLLHDIGMTQVPSSILNKTEPLSESELNQIIEHAEAGFEILRTNREISTLSAHIAFQHHERLDGTGYPRQLRGGQIIEYAKIAAVADTFDSIVSDRPYRRGYSISDALIILRKLARSQFDPEIVEAFANNVAVYPVGSLLEIHTGHIALVTAVDRDSASRPVINVLCDISGKLIIPSFTINLMTSPNVSITRRLDADESNAIKEKIMLQINEQKAKANPTKI